MTPVEGSTAPFMITGPPPIRDCKVPVALLPASTVIRTVPVSKLPGIADIVLLYVPVQTPANADPAVGCDVDLNLEQPTTTVSNRMTINAFMDLFFSNDSDL